MLVGHSAALRVSPSLCCSLLYVSRSANSKPPCSLLTLPLSILKARSHHVSTGFASLRHELNKAHNIPGLTSFASYLLGIAVFIDWASVSWKLLFHVLCLFVSVCPKWRGRSCLLFIRRMSSFSYTLLNRQYALPWGQSLGNFTVTLQYLSSTLNKFIDVKWFETYPNWKN